MKRLGNDKERPKLTERDKGQLTNASGNIQTFFPLTQEGLYYSESWRMLILLAINYKYKATRERSSDIVN